MPTITTRMLMPAPNGPLNGFEVRPLDDSATRGTAMLLPGIAGAKEDFLPLMECLAEAGYRTFVVDLCRQNETDGAGDPVAYTVAELALDAGVALTAAAARQPIHFFGHAFGAVVAAHACTVTPEKYLSLTLMSPQWAGGSAAGEQPAPISVLKATGVPVLVASGAGDSLAPAAEAERIARELGARHEIVPGAGHDPHHDDPETLAAALASFWAAADAIRAEPLAAALEVGVPEVV